MEHLASDKRFTPKVSVIIPVYNEADHLCECLESVLAQTMCDIEVLCVDDGSTDTSPVILDEYHLRDSRVHVIRQKNAGSGIARNNALDSAKGQCIVFMDPDDYYPSPHVLERLYGALIDSGCMLSAGRMVRVPKEDPRAVRFNSGYKALMAFPRVGVVSLDEYQSPFRFTCYMYRKVLLDENGIRFPVWRRFQDPPFLARVLIAAQSFCAIDEDVYCYRLRDNGSGVPWSADGCVRLKEFFGGFHELLDIAESANCREMYREAAGAFAKAHRFDGIASSHPMWAEVLKTCREMRNTGWLTYGNFASLLRLVRSEEPFLRRFREIIRALGLRGVVLGGLVGVYRLLRHTYD